MINWTIIFISEIFFSLKISSSYELLKELSVAILSSELK